MASETIPVKVGNVTVHIQATQPALATQPAQAGPSLGAAASPRVSAPVSPPPGAAASPRVSAPVSQVEEAFTKAQATIAAIASSTVGTIRELTDRAARPDQLQVQFGLCFSATGDVIVAGATGQATLQVTLVYNTAQSAHD